MNLPKIILPPALCLIVLVIIIYGMGSCMAAVPEPYRVQGPWVVETKPEREVDVFEAGLGSPMTISLFSWGALFTLDNRDLGSLRYDRVYYALRDDHNVMVWKMTSHDTYVAVTDPHGDELFNIMRYKDRIDFVDSHGVLFSRIVIAGDSASLFSADGARLATAITTPSGIELQTPGGAIVFISDRAVSPAGLVASALPSFDRLERAALMIMVK
jgi:hypothetical protein